jgi:ATP-dependent Clp protease ATP-binding subunit ClpC
MPKINVYLPEELAAAVRDAQVPVSAICQKALERAVRDVAALRAGDAMASDERLPIGKLERFTARARQVLVLAERSAREVPHDYVGTEHVLLGLIDEGGNLALKALEGLDIDLNDLRQELVASMGPATEAVEGHIRFTPLSKRALKATLDEALSMSHNYIGCEHMLLGLLATENGLASQVLRRMGVELRTTRLAVVNALAGYVHAQQNAASSAPAAPTDDALRQILQRLDAIEQRLAG